MAVYARVSTGNVEQTSSYELQKKYYEDYVRRHPNWTLARIYADEGISGTSLAHREQFHQMITDCKAGKIDLILTKSVSRFARNVVDCISTVRMLSELSSPVGVFFESECIFSLKEDSQMALSFQATMAQEESHTRSRSMETSLRMRLDGGLPLTPKLLGYSHDSEGNLVVNPQEAPTVKLIFYLYLYGYSTSEIAEILTRQGRKTYLGNLRWTSNTVVQVLRNERHCGDVLTRKTFTPNYLTHKAKKNKGDRPQSLYRNHHEAIVSREDFIAVQHLLDNAKYGNKSFLPELRVVDQGLLRGFVVLHPRWAGFRPEDYLQASAAAHAGEEEKGAAPSPWDGFERTRSQLFSDAQQASMVFQRNKVRLSALCVRDLAQQGGTVGGSPAETAGLAHSPFLQPERPYLLYALQRRVPSPRDGRRRVFLHPFYTVGVESRTQVPRIRHSLPWGGRDSLPFPCQGRGGILHPSLHRSRCAGRLGTAAAVWETSPGHPGRVGFLLWGSFCPRRTGGERELEHERTWPPAGNQGNTSHHQPGRDGMLYPLHAGGRHGKGSLEWLTIQLKQPGKPKT